VWVTGGLICGGSELFETLSARCTGQMRLCGNIQITLQMMILFN
jgi:hypothetical protein